MNADDKVTKKQGDSTGTKDASSQAEAGTGTQEKGQEKGADQDLKDKLAQGDKKAGEAGSQASPSPTDKEEMKLSKGEQQQAEDTSGDMATADKKSKDGTTPKGEGSQKGSQSAGSAMIAKGEGKEAGIEPGGSEDSQKQQGSGGDKGDKGKGPGEEASSQMAGKSGDMGQGESAEGTGDSMQKIAGQGQDKSGGSESGDSEGGALSSADLKNMIASQMASLSGQISSLEKKMGMDIGDIMDEIRSMGNTSKQENGDTGTNILEQAKEKLGEIGEIAMPGGDKPGEQLYSSEPEKIVTSEGSEKMELKVEGTKDELGTARETISIGKGEPVTAKRRKLPTVGYDDTVKLSEEQAEDDAMRKTSIPLEYEDIIKKIHSDKE
jgi:hypothetical protein